MKNMMVGILAIVFTLLIFLIGPALIIWVINSLSEAGGSKFYIEHSLWNYWVAFVGLMLVRGGN